MMVTNATTTAIKLSTKRNLECINGDSSDPRPIKRRRTSDNEITNSNHPKMSIPTLLSQGVDRPTWILQKTLQKTDLDLYESRLLLTSKKVASSPLLELLTDTERESVREKSGLKVRAFDWLGKEYCMVFKFLQSNNAYRLIGEWSRFLRENDGAMRAGDSIEIWGFRILREDGCTEIGMALLHYDKEEEEEREKKLNGDVNKSIKSKEMKVTEEEEYKEKKIKSVRKGNVSKSTKSKKMKVTEDEWTADEWTAVVALLLLKGV